MDPNYIRIFDTTLRDGEQSPGFSMNLEEKKRIALQLEKLGVDVIEAGFPAASPDDFLAVQTIARTLKKPEICGLTRAIEGEIKHTWDAIKDAEKPRIHTFIATSPIHMEHKLKKTPDQILAMGVKAVKIAKSCCDRVDFSPEDAGRSDRDFLVRIITAAIDAGADVINVPDTVGYNQPSEFGNLIEYLIKNVRNSDQALFSTHCHDDLGLAVANSLAGVSAGARQIECTINGIGERAGNASLEELVMNLRTREDFFQLKHGIITQELYPTSQLLQQITGQKVQSNKAIVGKNAFAHESGIHQDGMLKSRETYEIMTPAMVGVEGTKLVLGKHSGRAALKDRLNTMGYDLEEAKFMEIFVAFKALADKKKEITQADLDILVTQEPVSHKKWTLYSLSIRSEEGQAPWAEISLKNQTSNEILTKSCEGDGTVDAAFQCLESLVGSPGLLTNFVIDNVTDGIDAQATVSVRFQKPEGSMINARAKNTDIIRASVEAYLEALNQS